MSGTPTATVGTARALGHHGSRIPPHPARGDGWRSSFRRGPEATTGLGMLGAMTREELMDAFKIYWSELELCRSAGAYWALLHVTVCLPDICAALQSHNGRTNGNKYRAWCGRFLTNPLLSANERWLMRCAVLHQGRSKLPVGSRYTGFSFSRPNAQRQVLHNEVEGTTLIQDVDVLSREVTTGVIDWMIKIALSPGTVEAEHVAKNLPRLIRVREFPLPALAGSPILPFGTTITRSS